MQALIPLVLALLLACRANALDPQVRIVLPETITSDLARATTLRPEVEITNNSETPVVYLVESSDGRTIWPGSMSFALRDGTGADIHFYLPLLYSPPPHALTLPAGASIRIRYPHLINVHLQALGTYTLSGTMTLEDKAGKRHKIVAQPAIFVLEKRAASTAPQENRTTPTASAISAN